MHANLMKSAHQMAECVHTVDQGVQALKIAMATRALQSAIRRMQTIQETHGDLGLDSDIRYYQEVWQEIQR